MRNIIISLLCCLLSVAVFAKQQPQKGTTIALKKGQTTFDIKLKSNPTTGYRWYLGRFSSGLQPLTAKYTAYQGKLIGAPGSVVWQFELKPGSINVPRVMMLQLVYMRAWDYASAMKKTFWVVTG